TNKEITPWGGMVFLKQMLDKMQFSQIISSCKHLPVPGFNRGYLPEVTVESFIACCKITNSLARVYLMQPC
ncbi:MAG TPA: hypothetical protein PKD40_04445, partial [Saprospiraceae bacterium]|nr:hypothetical protein [Saprospiraceae bacterium]